MHRIQIGEKTSEQVGFILLATFWALLLRWLSHQITICSVSEALVLSKCISVALLKRSSAAPISIDFAC